MDSDTVPGLILLALGIIAFVLLIAAEAGVIAGVRERALREPAESRLDALRRFYQERQLTLSSLALARTLALVGVTAIIVFLVVREAGHNWPVLTASVFGTVLVIMLLQTFPRMLVARNPARWQSLLRPFVSFVR